MVRKYLTTLYGLRMKLQASHIFTMQASQQACSNYDRNFMQGRSHQYGWSGFNWTTFQGNNHIIHKFSSALAWPIGSHVATVDRARDRWLQIVCTSVQSMKVPQGAHPDSWKMKAKNFSTLLHRQLGTTLLYAAAFSSMTPLLQTSSTASATWPLQTHGYSPVMACGIAGYT